MIRVIGESLECLHGVCIEKAIGMVQWLLGLMAGRVEDVGVGKMDRLGKGAGKEHLHGEENGSLGGGCPESPRRKSGGQWRLSHMRRRS